MSESKLKTAVLGLNEAGQLLLEAVSRVDHRRVNHPSESVEEFLQFFGARVVHQSSNERSCYTNCVRVDCSSAARGVASNPHFSPDLVTRVAKGVEYWVCRNLGDAGIVALC